MTKDSLSADDATGQPADLSRPEETIGGFLKRHRQNQGKDLDEVAEITRIHASTLRAIEEGNPKALPAEVFTRGFIRNYARYLGLDPEEALALYIEENKGEVGPTEKINVREVLAGEVLAEPRRFPIWRFIVFFLVAALIFFAGYFIFGFANSLPSSLDTFISGAQLSLVDQQPQQTSPEIGEPGVESGAGNMGMEQVPPVTQSGIEDLAPQAVATPSPAATVLSESSLVKAPGMNYVLAAKFTEETWLSVQIDQEKQRSFIYQPGDHAVWQAGEKISLFVGNAGGIALTLNGKPVPPLGESMKIVRISFPAQ